MQHQVVIPQLGLTMTEGSVSTWLKKSGEPIRKGEPLFSVETDKVEMEVEATASGFLAGELLEPQKVVPVGTVIGVIVDSKAEIAHVVDSAGQQPPAVVAAAAVAGGTSLQYAASPLAKRLSKELGVDLRGLMPANGIRISAEDVHRAAALKSGTSPAGDLPRGANVATPPAVAGARAAIANRVSESFLRAPHFYLGVEIDATELVGLRNRTLSAAEKAGVR